MSIHLPFSLLPSLQATSMAQKNGPKHQHMFQYLWKTTRVRDEQLYVTPWLHEGTRVEHDGRVAVHQAGLAFLQSPTCLKSLTVDI